MSYTYQNKQQSGTETDIITYLILLETFGYIHFMSVCCYFADDGTVDTSGDASSTGRRTGDNSAKGDYNVMIIIMMTMMI